MPADLLLAPIAAVGAACILAKRVGAIVPFAFIAAYVLAVGAVTFINISVFHMADPKFGEMWVWPWLVLYWPLWTLFFAPSAISALLACWLSRPVTRNDATLLLGVYLSLILVVIEVNWALERYVGEPGVLLVGGFALLTTVFLATAVRKRALNAV